MKRTVLCFLLGLTAIVSFGQIHDSIIGANIVSPKIEFSHNLSLLSLRVTNVKKAKRILGKTNTVKYSALKKTCVLCYITELRFEKLGVELFFTGAKKKSKRTLSKILIYRESPIVLSEELSIPSLNREKVLSIFGNPKYIKENAMIFYFVSPRRRIDFLFGKENLSKIEIVTY